MPMTFDSYRTQGTRVDPTLFISARNQGIQGGNAQVGGLQGVFQGVTQGMSDSLQMQEQAANIQLKQQQHEAGKATGEVMNSPEGVAARKRILEAEATTAEARAKAGGIVEVKKAELEAQKASTSLFDLENLEAIGQVISTALTTDPNIPAQIFNDPRYQQTFQRQPEAAVNFAAQLGARGYAQAQAYAAPYQAMIKQQAITESAASVQKALALSADKGEANDSFFRLMATNELKKYADNNSMDLRGIDLVPGKAVQAGPDGRPKVVFNPSTGMPVTTGVDSSHYVYADKAGNTYGYIDKTAYPEALKDLTKVKATLNARGIPTREDLVSTDTQSSEAPDVPTLGGGGIGGGASPGPAPAPTPGLTSNQNEEILANARRRLKDNTSSAGVVQGRSLATSRVNSRDFVAPYLMSTSVQVQGRMPVGPYTASESYEQRLAKATGARDVRINLDTQVKLTDDTVNKINSIPEIGSVPAIIKGLIAIESGGNIDAMGAAGEVGLTQVTPGAAADVGMGSANLRDPTNSVTAGAMYFDKMYNDVRAQLIKLYKDRSTVATEPDPRVVLAAYNGGMKYVQNAIRAGNTSWEDVKAYINNNTNKSAENKKTNTEYPDKVVSASLAFIQGDNYSDLAYIHALKYAGVLEGR